MMDFAPTLAQQAQCSFDKFRWSTVKITGPPRQVQQREQTARMIGEGMYREPKKCHEDDRQACRHIRGDLSLTAWPMSELFRT